MSLSYKRTALCNIDAAAVKCIQLYWVYLAKINIACIQKRLNANLISTTFVEITTNNEQQQYQNEGYE